MIKKDIVTSSTKVASYWDVFGITMQKDRTVITVAGFWDKAHYDTYNSTSNVTPAEVKMYEVDHTLLDSVTKEVMIPILEGGKNFRELGKTLIERYLVAQEPEWVDAVIE